MINSKKNRSRKAKKSQASKPNQSRPETINRGSGITQSRPKPRTTLRKDVEILCGLSDPFCSAAVNAKYMDNSSTKSLPYTTHIRNSFTTNASGNVGILICPSWNYYPFSLPSATAGTVYTFGAPRAVLVPPAGAARVRLVSYGIVCRSVVAPLSASGMVRVRGFAVQDGFYVSVCDGTTYNCDFYEDFPLRDVANAAVIGRRTDPTCKNFRTPPQIDAGNLVTNWIAPGFGPILISVDGAPASTSVLDIEIVLHWEITLDDSSDLQQLSTKSPAYDLVLDTAQSTMSSVAQNVFKQGVQAAGKYIESLAVRALGSAVPAARPLLLLT